VSGADRFDAAAEALGLRPQTQRFRDGTKTAEDAARAIGCDVDQIVKSLVFITDDGEPLLCLASGRHRVDLAKLATAAGAASVRRATPEEARASTGFAIGGTPPFGHPQPIRTVIDETLGRFETVWAAGGMPDRVFPIDPARLAAVSQGSWAVVAEEIRPAG
jgi:Cys-tRNA(Pro) deacylase